MGALLCFSSKAAIAAQLNAWKVLPRPERFSELYFTDYARLPITFAPGRLQTVGFGVHNLEHDTIQYRYTIVAQAAGKKKLLADGQLTLAHDGTQTISRRITVPLLDDRTEVQVQLQYSGIPFGHEAASMETQTIHYWINRAP